MSSRTGRSGVLELNHITAVARELISERGIDDLSMRNLAAVLDVAPMTLYSYVDSKEDLLNKVADHLLDELETPVVVSGSWSEHIFEMMKQFYELLVSHPDLARLLSTQRVISVGLTRFIEGILTVLESAGFSDEQSAHAFMSFLQYTYGAACLAIPRATYEVSELDNDPYTKGRLDTIFGSGRFPRYTAKSNTLFKLGQFETFEYGLNHLIEGFRHALDGDEREQ